MGMGVLARLAFAGVMVGSVYALVGMSYSLLYKGTGLINWAQGDAFMIGAFTAWAVLSQWPGAFALAVVAALFVGFGLNWIIYRGPVAAVTRRNGQLVDVLLVTIGVSFLLQNLVMRTLGSTVKAVPPFVGGAFTIGPVITPRQYVIVLVVAMVAVVALHLFLYRTGFGRLMRATADNPYAAVVVGLPVPRVNATTWGIGGALAAVAGALIAPLFGAHFPMGLLIGLKGFAASVAGGFGNVYGALAGGLLIGLAETFAAAYLSSAWKDGIALAILIGFLLLRPTGLFRSEVGSS